MSGLVALPGRGCSSGCRSLTVDGRTYAGWTDIRVSRGLDRCATDFDISVSERSGSHIASLADQALFGVRHFDRRGPDHDRLCGRLRSVSGRPFSSRAGPRPLPDAGPHWVHPGHQIRAVRRLHPRSNRPFRSARCSTSVSPWRRTGPAPWSRTPSSSAPKPRGRSWNGSAAWPRSWRRMTRKAGSCSPGRGQRAPAAALSRARIS